MKDDIVRNICGHCGGGIHQAIARDGRAVWIHDDRAELADWMVSGGTVHVPTPANLSEPVTDKEVDE